MNQIKNTSEETYLSSEHTHPSWLIRIRALQWFMMSNTYNNVISNNQKNLGDSIEKIDELIHKDLENFIDKPIREEIEVLKKD